MNADEFLDTPDAESFLGTEPAKPAKPTRVIGGRGSAPTRAPMRFDSVLQQPDNAAAFSAAPDPRQNAEALFNALTNNPDLIKSPMYAPGAAMIQAAASGQPTAIQSAVEKSRLANIQARRRAREVTAAREATDQAFGGPVGQAIFAPGRRLASGVAQVVGGVASIPQLFGSDLGKETSAAANLMAAANMPEDPGIADEVLAGAGQILPMIGGASAIRALALPLLGEAGATGLATTLSGAAGGAMTGGEVLRDLEDRPDLSPDERRRRALAAALFSALTSKYADRFLIPGADKAAGGILSAGARGFAAEGVQEGLDQLGQNVATDRPLMAGVPRAALIGGLVGGGARAASGVSSPEFQIAQAIDADANALANAPTPRAVWAPTEPRVAEPLTAPPPAAAEPAIPALPYDPSVKAGPDIMVADKDGAVRPMTSAEFLDAEDTRQEGIDTGLTPDVRRAQEQRTEPSADVKVEPDLVQRLMAAGWKPPETSNAREDAPAPAAPDQDAAESRAPVAAAPQPDGATGADGLRASQPDATLNPDEPPKPAAEPADLLAPPRSASDRSDATPQAEPAEQFSRASTSLLPNGYSVEEGSKGQAKGKFRVIDEDGNSLGNWADTEQAAVADAQRLGARRAGFEQERTRLEQDYERVTAKVKAGEDLTDVDLQAIGLRPGGARYDFLSPRIQRLLGIPARKVREAIGPTLKVGTGIFGGKIEEANPRQAIVAAREWLKSQDAQASRTGEDAQFRGPVPSLELPATSTADTMHTELRERFGDVIDRLEKRGILKLWDNLDAYNSDPDQPSQLPADARGVQGMYSRGVAHLFGDGVEPGHAVAVFLHEVGEHASMKAMLGERYSDLVRRAYRLVADGDEIAETAMDRIPDNTPAKFQDSELLAYMIEETASREAKASPAARSWLRDVIAAIRAWFYQTGLAKQLERYSVKLDLTPKDIAALAVRAVRWQAEQEGGKAEPASSSPVDFELSRKPPVSSTGGQQVQNLGTQPWTVAEPGTWDNIVRTIQNNKVDLKRVQAAIEEQFGRIPEAKDAYLNEELYHGKVAARVEKLHDDYVLPILRKIAVAEKNAGVTLDDVNLYLHARHAPERNAAMKAINPGMANNDSLSGMSDTEAARVMQDFRASGKEQALQTIVKDIDTLLADTRTALVADGLEEASTIQAWEQAYKHYVPLQRDVDGKPAKGQGVSIRGPEAKRATGSTRAAVNILANVVTQAETAAIRAEKAEVGRALLELANAYPNADFWKVDTPPTKPRVNPNTGLVERNAVEPNYQAADNVVMVKDYGATRFIVFNERNERAKQVARAMKNLEIAQLPKAIQYAAKATRFMASLLTARNPEFWMTNFTRDLQTAGIQMNGTEAEGLQRKVLTNLPKAMAGMRHVARNTGVQTQWARYAQELSEAGGTTGYMQMFENSDERMKDLQKEVDRMNQGAADPRRLARSVIEFIDDYNDVVENGVRLAVFQTAREAGVSTKRAASLAKNITVNFNRKGNLTPLVNSLYMFFNANIQGTARMAQALATSGKARAIVGGIALSAFVMDIVNRALAGEDDETKRNRYDLINEFEKSRNWIFMGSDGNYVKVPLPMGYSLFHNAGRLLSDAMFRKDARDASEYGWSFASQLLDTFNPIGQVASVGQFFAPSVLRPVVQLAENKSAFGSPVYRSGETPFGKTDPRPAYQRYFDTTPDFWKSASKAMNNATGGDKVKPGFVNIEPDILRHIYGAMTGGPGLAVERIADTAQAKARGEDITAARIPFARRFLGEVGDRQRDTAYWQDMKRVARAKDQFEYLVKAGRRQDAIEILKDLGDGDVTRGRQVIAKFDAQRKSELALNRQLRQLREQDSDSLAASERIKEIKQRRAQGRHRVLEDTSADEE